MWQDLGAALALVLVLEGLLPFIRPQAAQRLYEQLSGLDARALRRVGLVSMVAGVAFLYLVRG